MVGFFGAVAAFAHSIAHNTKGFRDKLKKDVARAESLDRTERAMESMRRNSGRRRGSRDQEEAGCAAQRGSRRSLSELLARRVLRPTQPHQHRLVEHDADRQTDKSKEATREGWKPTPLEDATSKLEDAEKKLAGIARRIGRRGFTGTDAVKMVEGICVEHSRLCFDFRRLRRALKGSEHLLEQAHEQVRYYAHISEGICADESDT